MPTFQKCTKDVHDLCRSILTKHESHNPVLHHEVKIDLVFAFGDQDDKGRVLNDALSKNGIRALGICRAIPLKDRVLGRGDAEISLDGDWWGGATESEQEALLDHELHHVSVQADKAGNVQFDDIGRPKIKLRKHDVEIGWFKCVAERNGISSQEQIQAKAIMDQAGQFFWPDVVSAVKKISGTKTMAKASAVAV